MTTINKKQLPSYSPSANIERDHGRTLSYIPTPNSEEAYLSIANDYRTGSRCINIVGAYGTGKSSFLLALEQTLAGRQKFFKRVRNQYSGLDNFNFIRIVGSNDSLLETFARHLQVPVTKNLSSQQVLQALKTHAKKLGKKDIGLVIFLDEFGKFLEYAAKNNPERELYFIQELAELINDTEFEMLLLTTLHHDFSGYSRALSKSQQYEWHKVRGRFKELPFNEPVEQLLFLAAERIGELKVPSKAPQFNELYACIEKSKLFPLTDYNSKAFASKLLPFDLLAAAVMTTALQRYGQNERSLFAFIESSDILGIKEFDPAKSPYYNLASVYDYLSYNFFSFLQSNDNTDKSHWYALRSAIERCDGLMDEKAPDAAKIVKAIGLLNIFGATSGKLNKVFLEHYAVYSLGIKNAKVIIESLESKKIIRFAVFSQRFILFEGTDVDIDLAINQAGDLIESVTDIVTSLSKYFEGGFVPAKSAFYHTGTPRFFQFLLSERPETGRIPEGEIDGFINLVFSENLTPAEVQRISADCHEATLFGFFKNTGEIKKELVNIEKVKKAIEAHRDDRVAVRVLEEVKEGHLKLLNHYINGSIYSATPNIQWFFAGQRVMEIADRKTFNQTLSWICTQVYDRTPIYKNELFNKTSYASVVSNSRKDLLKKLIENPGVENIGYLPQEFPPSKSIYLSMLKDTGIHRKDGDVYVLTSPNTDSLQTLWEASQSFLDSTQFAKRNLKDLEDILLLKPYKCKQGLIDFWIPIFLVIKSDDFALFYQGIFIHDLTEITLDLVVRNIKDFEIKAFQVEGVRLDLFNRYRTLINRSESPELKISSFIDTIKPFVAFYNKLTAYAKQTQSVSDNAKRLREAILTSQDPEVTFFEKFPEAFGYTLSRLRDNPQDLKAYIDELQEAIRELRTVYGDLTDRFEGVIQNEILGGKGEFEDCQRALGIRFADIKEFLLNPAQTKVLNQLVSPIDDRSSWLNSISQACTDKRLDALTDMDEKVLHDKFQMYINQLDSLCILGKQSMDADTDDIIRLEVSSFVENIQERIIRMPKSKSAEAGKLADKLGKTLSGDKQLNIVTLIKLLKQQLGDD